MRLAPGFHWLAPRHERTDGDAREGGYYVVDLDGTERGPFAECPPGAEALERAEQAARIQMFLVQEPRP